MALVCYDCGAANDGEALLCAACDCTILTTDTARPIYAAPVDHEADELPAVWDVLGRWPEGSVVALDGGPGAGKSSLCALLEPGTWITTEETVKQATEALRRLQDAEGDGWPSAPQIMAREGLAGVLDALWETYDGLAVIDSVTATGHAHEQLEVMQAIIDWARGGPGRRAVAILGHTQAGGAAGPRKIAHLAQAELSVVQDSDGRRALHVRKNRHGPLTARYFELGAHGVEVAGFPYAYSVEGPPGAYELAPYPTRGAKWAGRFEGLQASEATLPLRCASAARSAPYGGGYLEPRDAGARRAFAAAHGLDWLDNKGRHTAPGV